MNTFFSLVMINNIKSVCAALFVLFSLVQSGLSYTLATFESESDTGIFIQEKNIVLFQQSHRIGTSIEKCQTARSPAYHDAVQRFLKGDIRRVCGLC